MNNSECLSGATGRAGSGPLAGVRIVEFAGIGPGPFAVMMLADMGAEVVSVARPGNGIKPATDFIFRGRRVVELDLRREEGWAKAIELAASADAVVEGFRPGVMERMGLGPDQLIERNPRLVFARMTGWGQSGPLSSTAGHDINYLSLTGAIDSIRSRQGEPVAPLNLVGDYGGGALYLVVGILAALLEVQRTGRGQVIDAAICDGAASLMSVFHSLVAQGRWPGEPGHNLLDGGAHFYGTFRCADGKYFALGAIEPQFHAILCEKLGLECRPAEQLDRAAWPRLRERVAEIVKSRTLAEWTEVFQGSDACASPVLSMNESVEHPHMVARGVYDSSQGFVQPRPAPRFSNHTGARISSVAEEASNPDDILRAWHAREPAEARD